MRAQLHRAYHANSELVVQSDFEQFTVVDLKSPRKRCRTSRLCVPPPVISLSLVSVDGSYVGLDHAIIGKYFSDSLWNVGVNCFRKVMKPKQNSMHEKPDRSQTNRLNHHKV